jgi:hypothetical protein
LQSKKNTYTIFRAPKKKGRGLAFYTAKYQEKFAIKLILGIDKIAGGGV